MAEQQHDERILTVPSELDDVAPVLATANEWVALPDVSPTSAAVPSATVLHRGAAGLVALEGAPLSRPRVVVDGAELGEHDWQAELLNDHLPRHTQLAGGCRAELTTFCPPGHKGLVQTLQVVNEGSADAEVALGLHGRLVEAHLHVFTARPLPGPHRARWDDWTAALTWEAGAGLAVAALALRSDDGRPPTTASDTPEAPPVSWAHERSEVLAPGERTTLTLYWGVGREADGAALSTVHLARVGAGDLLAATRDWLRARRGAPLPDRPELERLRERNRLFCLGFAAGRTLDTEELVLVTSRSPRYYVSGAHWSRDALLWAFPAVLEVDSRLAADWLRAAFGLYTRNVGDHALYLDGTALYPGFELDEVAAFHLALDAYLAATDDVSLLDEDEVRRGLERVEAALAAARDPATGLLRTFLLPTDDPAPLPFVTYDNALAVAALRAAARTAERHGATRSATALRARADEVWAAVLDRAVVEGPLGPMLCGATDGRGRHALFDEPPGSLELLAHYGLLDVDDPLLATTIAWIGSEHNPYGPGEGRYAAPACAHADHPWLLAVGNALLRGERRWLDLLPELELDAGLACESFDAATGQPRTGVGFATCAGWLAHAIDLATRSDRSTPA